MEPRATLGSHGSSSVCGRKGGESMLKLEGSVGEVLVVWSMRHFGKQVVGLVCMCW